MIAMCGCTGDALNAVAELTPATDSNPALDIVEVSLVVDEATVEYLDGQPAKVLAYRDGAIDGSTATVPGPMIVANRGDRLIVHVTNELDRATSVHWHGLRLPVEMDGVVPIEAGATFDFDFVLRDAGLFWYHPHVETDEQVELGLQGALLVDDADEPNFAVERTFMLDDIELDGGEVVIEPTHDDLVHGRRGNTLLVNGKPPGVLRTAADSVERWRIVNTSNGRFFRLSLGGLALRVIGWDGGLIPTPYDVTELVIGPGERYDVVGTLDGTEGDVLSLRTLEVLRGHGAVDRGPLELIRIELGAAAANRDDVPFAGPTFDALPIVASTPARRFELSEQLEGSTGTFFFINDQRWPLNTPVDVRLGDLEVLELVNETEGEHPLHIHGHFVQVLERDGIATPMRGWKDTISIGPNETVRAGIRYDAPGMWMLHCQIPEHAERGMTADLDVQP